MRNAVTPREPVSIAHVVQYLAHAPEFGSVTIHFEDGAPTRIESRTLIRLTERSAQDKMRPG